VFGNDHGAVVDDWVAARIVGGHVNDSRSEFVDRSVFTAVSLANDEERPIDS
jgi:hypothetical protein